MSATATVQFLPSFPPVVLLVCRHEVFHQPASVQQGAPGFPDGITSAHTHNLTHTVLCYCIMYNIQYMTDIILSMCCGSGERFGQAVNLLDLVQVSDITSSIQMISTNLN